MVTKPPSCLNPVKSIMSAPGSKCMRPPPSHVCTRQHVYMHPCNPPHQVLNLVTTTTHLVTFKLYSKLHTMCVPRTLQYLSMMTQPACRIGKWQSVCLYPAGVHKRIPVGPGQLHDHLMVTAVTHTNSMAGTGCQPGQPLQCTCHQMRWIPNPGFDNTCEHTDPCTPGTTGEPSATYVVHSCTGRPGGMHKQRH